MSKTDTSFFGSGSITRILLRLAPPVMLAQLIQAAYNIVDSYFVGMYSGDGLTALSVIFPLQLVITALAIGTGVGVNTLMASQFGKGDENGASESAGTGTVLALVMWAIFAVVSFLFMRVYVKTSATSALAVEYGVIYGRIVCVGSLGIFLESIWTKVHQAGGNMRRPMVAQILGALTNIVFDPLLIFGAGPFPELGIAGAAYATVMGQFVAAAITLKGGFRRIPSAEKLKNCTRRIYSLGIPSILMQMMFTVYIVVLNIILATFSDAAVTVLGLYYKIQTFFFIPLMALQTCVVPVMSYNFVRTSYDRCRRIMVVSSVAAMVLMVIGVLCFEFIPGLLIGLFSKNAEVLEIGIHAFRIIGISFIPAVPSLMSPVFFQAVGAGRPSIALSIIRQLVCLIPLFYLFSLIGLGYTWLAFPLAETITGTAGLIMLYHMTRRWTA